VEEIARWLNREKEAREQPIFLMAHLVVLFMLCLVSSSQIRVEESNKVRNAIASALEKEAVFDGGTLDDIVSEGDMIYDYISQGLVGLLYQNSWYRQNMLRVPVFPGDATRPYPFYHHHSYRVDRAGQNVSVVRKYNYLIGSGIELLQTRFASTDQNSGGPGDDIAFADSQKIAPYLMRKNQRTFSKNGDDGKAASTFDTLWSRGVQSTFEHVVELRGESFEELPGAPGIFARVKEPNLQRLMSQPVMQSVAMQVCVVYE
jgi:hypothetical protein